MLTPARKDNVSEKCEKFTEREKAFVITTFLNEYGENATWEDWRSFLCENQVKVFEWTNSVD